jgi:hypothetical protein
VDVSGNLLGGQQPELLPRPLLGLVYCPDDGEIPLLKRRVRRQAGGEDREAVHQVLVIWAEGNTIYTILASYTRNFFAAGCFPYTDGSVLD